MKRVVEARLLDGDQVRLGVYQDDPTKFWIEYDEFDRDDPDLVLRRRLGEMRIEELRASLRRIEEIAAEFQEELWEQERQAAEQAEAEQVELAPLLHLVPKDEDDPTGSEG